MRPLLAVAVIPALLALSSTAALAQSFYHLESATTLEGKSPDWDYVALDATRPILFIGRRGDGAAVFDLAKKQVVKTLEDSEGAGAIRLVPEFDLGYTANEDGTSTMFKLSTLKTIKRVPFGKDSDSVFYDPKSKQLVFTMGDSHALAFMDAKTGAVTGTLPVDSGKLDGSAADGAGNMFVALRDKNKVIKVDVAQRKLLAEYPTDGCVQPTGLDYDAASKRIFVGCRSEKPVLDVLDGTSGKVVATLPIGHGVDGVVFDAATKQVYTSNGVDANLVIYAQETPDSYKLVEATTTRPYARTMALDPKTKKVYSVTAEGVADPSKKINTAVTTFYPNTYYDDTFTVLTYTR
ncbi:MAG: YncE family protein [Rudaea sp.]|uniref:YncE family protein n=1 Tax=Rudaea sp. TaxID=2136325 RepID=UPI0039E44F24